MTIHIGLSLRQNHKASGICIVEALSRSTEEEEEDWESGLVFLEDEAKKTKNVNETHFVVRYLESFPAGSGYASIFQKFREITQRICERNDRDKDAARPRLFVDVTGLGDFFVEEINAMRLNIAAETVYFNYGDRRKADGNEVILGKAYLVSRMQWLLQCNRIHFPKSESSDRLAKELLQYKIQQYPSANETEGAFQVTSRDELVTALGITVQTDFVSRPMTFAVA